MKRLLLIVPIVVLCVTTGMSQRSFELGLSGGITNYFGDLGNEEWFQPSSTQPGFALTLRNFLGTGYSGNLYRPLSAEIRFSYNRLQYDETKPIGDREGWELRNYGRGIGFRNDLFGLSTHITYTFFSNPRIPLYKQHAAFFVFTGVGVFYGKPKADLFRGDIDINNRYYFWPDGTIRDAEYEGSSSAGNIIDKDNDYETDLSEWHTEGNNVNGEGSKSKSYSYYNIGIPLGFGIRYGVTKNITVSTELGYYMFFTDYIDDVSDAYPTFAEINAMYPNDPVKQEIALYISDPTGFGNSGYPNPATSPRGNPDKKDAHSYISLEIAYKFDFRKSVPKLWGRK